MGWAFCGKNSKTGQLMGYGIECKCHKRGCEERINRGLGYVCGGMHEGDDLGCGYYFCEKHLSGGARDCRGRLVQLCQKCDDRLPQSDRFDCKECGEDIEDGDQFCPTCGVEL